MANYIVDIIIDSKPNLSNKYDIKMVVINHSKYERIVAIYKFYIFYFISTLKKITKI